MSDWRDDANCVDNPRVGTRDFFPEDLFAGDTKEKRAHIGMLRSLCEGCLVLGECRAWADGAQITEGFVGGETHQERLRRWGRERRQQRRTRSNQAVKVSTIQRPIGGPALP